MARRTPTTAAALAISAALLLTACGGSNHADGTAKSRDSTAIASSPSTPSPPRAARPIIRLPRTFQLTFQNWTSSDPDQQAVLDDGKQQIRAGYAAIIANTPEASYLTFYDTASGLSQDKKWIRTYTGKNLTVMGKAPAYDARARLLGSSRTRAVLNYCMDESKAYSKDRATGKVEGNPAGTDPTVYYTVTLRKSSRDVWQAVSTSSKRGGCPS
ncbi:hypothetical protein [Streptomyces sp. NBC_00859]|uniref:hypothetical protein n=1 Tax=Streptomyces sp. NBC_00859 TaxID=2903682 RepID=UPI00386FA148|nr:hypothetical protein OG584_13865 [Streptomyces sp. NBC_00859]